MGIANEKHKKNVCACTRNVFPSYFLRSISVSHRKADPSQLSLAPPIPRPLTHKSTMTYIPVLPLHERMVTFGVLINK